MMTIVKCPQCGKETEYEGNEYRPFCSERCRLLDLGAWADEEYAMPTGESELTEDDLRTIERTHLERSRDE